MTETRADHWQNVYATKADDSVSWFEPSPVFSLQLIADSGSDRASVIDIGGGASRLVDALAADGLRHVAVLDLSAHALEIARSRLERFAIIRQHSRHVGSSFCIAEAGSRRGVNRRGSIIRHVSAHRLFGVGA